MSDTPNETVDWTEADNEATKRWHILSDLAEGCTLDMACIDADWLRHTLHVWQAVMNGRRAEIMRLRERCAELEASEKQWRARAYAMELEDQYAVWEWLGMDGEERADSALVNITTATGHHLARATAEWLKAVSLFPPAEERLTDAQIDAVEITLSDEQRTIASLRNRVNELYDENEQLKAERSA
jgi:hypothetical protein